VSLNVYLQRNRNLQLRCMAATHFPTNYRTRLHLWLCRASFGGWGGDGEVLEPERGCFFVDFSFDPGQENYIDVFCKSETKTCIIGISSLFFICFFMVVICCNKKNAWVSCRSK
jgi:hypothetical protein